MRALVFLTVRSIANGVRRAVTSPKRLIGLLLVVAYWANFLFRGAFGPDSARYAPPAGAVTLPTWQVVDAAVFAGFSVLSTLLLVTSLQPKGGFRPADVDVLFPTPVSPKAVLLFRMVRDYLFTLLIPLLFVLFGNRQASRGFVQIFRNYPEQGVNVLRAATVGWLLMALCWVCFGYALSLFVNRSDVRSDRNKRIIDVVTFAAIVGPIAYVSLRLRTDLSWNTALDVAHEPGLRVFFFLASGATAIVRGAFQGNPYPAAIGVVGMLLFIALSIRVALTQVGHLYDQAAARGFQQVNMRNMQRSGDTYAMIAEQARQGKVKAGRVAAWIGRLQLRRGPALLWKELLLQARGAMWIYIVFGPLSIAMTLLPLWGVSQRGNPMTVAAPLFLLFQGISVLTISLNTATGGFIELLRRVDLQKPLPFTGSVTVFWEVAAKAVPPTLIGIGSAIGAVVIEPRIWSAALASAIITPFFALVLIAVVLVVTILFPDVDDPSQRGFRGFMTLLACAIAGLPGGAILGLMVAYGLSPLLAAAVVIPVNLGIALGASSVAGGLYAGFNPSE